MRDNEYELVLPYREEAELDRRIQELITEISQEANLGHCLIKANVTEKATGRKW